ncbi:MAG: hypothetical protein R2912_05910 [Eubacteriales bacterium]
MNPQNKKTSSPPTSSASKQAASTPSPTRNRQSPRARHRGRRRHPFRKRYEFAALTGGIFHPKLFKDAQTYGNDAFQLTVLEEIERKDTQSDRDFRDDLDTLLTMWLEKIRPGNALPTSDNGTPDGVLFIMPKTAPGGKTLTRGGRDTTIVILNAMLH